MGHAGVAIDGVGSEQEDLRDDRGLAQSADRGRTPYVYLDGIVLKRSWAGEVRNVSLLVAIGVNGEGYREILGICEGAKEDKAGWSGFLKHLKERGLTGVRLIISDACIGLAESAAEFFPEAAWQRCIVHWYRNIFSHVPSTKVREIAAMLKAIHASEDIVAAREKAVRVIEKLRGLRLTKAAELDFSTVIDAQNLNDISLQSIGDDKGRLGDDQLTRRAVCWYGDRAVCASRVCR